MSGQNNLKISRLAKGIVRDFYGHRVKQVGQDLILFNTFLLSVNSKRYKTYPDTFDIKLTGKEPSKIYKLQIKQKAHGLKDVFVCFVDCLLEQCYGDTLTNLNKEHEFEGFSFPYKKKTRGSSEPIQYWSVQHILTLFPLTKQQTTDLRELTSDNATDKNQVKIEFK